MNKIALILIIVILALLVVGGIFYMSHKKSSSNDFVPSNTGNSIVADSDVNAVDTSVTVTDDASFNDSSLNDLG